MLVFQPLGIGSLSLLDEEDWFVNTCAIRFPLVVLSGSWMGGGSSSLSPLLSLPEELLLSSLVDIVDSALATDRAKR